MVAVLEDPAVRARTPAYSVEQYHKFHDLDVLPQRCELIRGAIVEKMPQSPAHPSAIEAIRRQIEPLLPPGTFIREEKPLTLADSEPAPDLAIIRGNWQDFRARHPSTALLVVEVSITSEAVDRLKLALYAEASIPEYWLFLPAFGAQRAGAWSVPPRRARGFPRSLGKRCYPGAAHDCRRMSRPPAPSRQTPSATVKRSLHLLRKAPHGLPPAGQ